MNLTLTLWRPSTENYIKDQAWFHSAPACFSETTGPIILKFGICISKILSWPYAAFPTDISGIFRTFHIFHRKEFPECISLILCPQSFWNFAEFLFDPFKWYMKGSASECSEYFGILTGIILRKIFLWNYDTNSTEILHNYCLELSASELLLEELLLCSWPKYCLKNSGIKIFLEFP